MARLPILRTTRVMVPSTALALLGLTVGPVASAQDDGGFNFSISPRAYLTAVDASEWSETTTAFMGGLSLTFGPVGGNWDLTVNGLSGSGDSDFTFLSENPILGWGQSGTYEFDRVDYEIVYRYRLEDSPVFIGFGARYIEVEEIFDGDIDGVVETETTDTTMGEFMVGFSTQASEGSKHGVFGNLLLGIGSFDYLSVGPSFADVTDDGTAIMIDTNIGYQYLMNRSSSFSARYRAIVVQVNAENSETTTVHGPEIAMTFRF